MQQRHVAGNRGAGGAAKVPETDGFDAEAAAHAALMSRKGDRLEFTLVRASGSNGPGGDRSKAQMESFLVSLKTKLVHRTRFRSRREAKAVLFECIAIFCTRQRRHSSIGCRTPEQARSDMAAATAA
ncbi:IS3 family transposase [Mangrovicoccus ximenensis]|uniref:IS3 family transposase n=1 Tax=Mangrovicoccus ximenensis TaxID=1911570 RepID=UPI0011AE9E61|nr:IS3 family transposase [Mangrovicoccus ximenensis]